MRPLFQNTACQATMYSKHNVHPNYQVPWSLPHVIPCIVQIHPGLQFFIILAWTTHKYSIILGLQVSLKYTAWPLGSTDIKQRPRLTKHSNTHRHIVTYYISGIVIQCSRSNTFSTSKYSPRAFFPLNIPYVNAHHHHVPRVKCRRPRCNHSK